DSFGNRAAATHNGQRIEYLVDPVAGVNVIGEYNEQGYILSRYPFGVGVANQVQSGGAAYFYDFDAIGSTVALTDVNGSSVNTYAYRPFGQPILSSEAVANPFEFVGKLGVMNDDNGLSFMRARNYRPEVGRFLTQDPTR